MAVNSMMTCGELINILQKYDPNRPIVIYPQNDYNKEQCKMFIKGTAELDYSNQIAILADRNRLVGVDFDKVKIVDEENGFLLCAETDNVVNVVV